MKITFERLLFASKKKPRYVITKSFYDGIYSSWIVRVRKRLMFRWVWADYYLSHSDGKWHFADYDYLGKNQGYKGNGQPTDKKYSS